VLDMGEPVRIADIARRLAASTGRDLEVVFTGLRPGEKLTEDRLGHAETDHRPCHPLICQVPVPALEPGQVTGLDPDADPGTLRQVLAARAYGPAHDGTPTFPPQQRAKTAAPRLETRSGIRPTKASQARHLPDAVSAVRRGIAGEILLVCFNVCFQ
jgi:hypothetical protein